MSGSFARHHVMLDISDDMGVAGTRLAATVVAPIHVAPTGVLAVAFPGGGYSRSYWDIQWPGGYSQAEHHVAQGWVFAAVDHLGIGDSSTWDLSTVTIEQMGHASAAATRQLVRQLRAGVLTESARPLDISTVIGVGHSMGGCVSIAAQAAFSAFDALAVLGYSPAYFQLPTRTGHREVAAAAAEGIDPQEAIEWIFHHEDEDAGIRNTDVHAGFPIRTQEPPPWGADLPLVALSLMNAVVVADEAAEITTPVFVGLGDRDVCSDTSSEAATYRASAGVTLQIVERMAHMHNFAPTRQVLWEGLHRWGESLSA